MRILISESQDILLCGMFYVLKKEGHIVKAAKNTGSFLKQNPMNYDVIIVDLDMLKTLSMEFANNIRSNPYSTVSLIGTFEKADNYRSPYLYEEILKKPFDIKTLLNSINKEDKNEKSNSITSGSHLIKDNSLCFPKNTNWGTGRSMLL